MHIIVTPMVYLWNKRVKNKGKKNVSILSFHILIQIMRTIKILKHFWTSGDYRYKPKQLTISVTHFWGGCTAASLSTSIVIKCANTPRRWYGDRSTSQTLSPLRYNLKSKKYVLYTYIYINSKRYDWSTEQLLMRCFHVYLNPNRLLTCDICW